MARLLIAPTNKFRSWSFDFSEEVILLDAYLKFSSTTVRSQQPWMDEFDYYYFQQGKPIAEAILDQFSTAARRHNIAVPKPKETTVFDMGRGMDYTERAQRRARIREDLETMKPDQRRAYVAEQAAVADKLPPPHYTAVEYAANRDNQRREAEQSRTEVSSRLALERHRAEQAERERQEKLIDLESASVMLEATDDVDLRSEIIGRLDKATKVAMLKAIQNQAIKNLIVKSLVA